MGVGLGVHVGVFLPSERSFVWLAERTTGRLAREREPRVKPMGASNSDMTSRASSDARELCSNSPKEGTGLGHRHDAAPCLGLRL